MTTQTMVVEHEDGRRGVLVPWSEYEARGHVVDRLTRLPPAPRPDGLPLKRTQKWILDALESNEFDTRRPVEIVSLHDGVGFFYLS